MDRVFAGLRRRAFAADPDDALLGRFAAGDEGAFAALVRRHGPLVYAAARRRLPDPADAADVFQATFLLLVRKAPRLAGRPTVGPWLYRAAALTARNLRRKNARRPSRLPDGLGLSADPDPVLRWDLDDALLALPERDRAAVVLCHLLGHTRQEAAVRLGMPEGTLSAVLHRALRRLRVRLGHDPVPLLVFGGATVPAALASATGRAATAAWAAGLSAGGPAAVGTAWAGKWLVAAVCVVAGLGVGLAVPRPKPAEPPPAVVDRQASVHVPGRAGEPIVWRALGAMVRLPDADALRARLDQDRPPRLTLTADPDVPPDRLLAAVRACVAAGFPSVQYAGPVPRFSEALGTETHDWTRDTVGEPATVHLPTAFGLHPPADTPEAKAVSLVIKLRGAVTRDDTRPGRPVVGVAMADVPLTDDHLGDLVQLTELATLDLRRTRVTDAGLPILARFPRLTRLDLRDTAVTAAGADLLRRALPGCHVER